MLAFSVRNAVLTLSVFALTITLTSGSIAARAGLPEVSWSAARAAYAAGDYAATLEQLESLTDTPNEFRNRAVPWSMVLSAGLASGYIELADGYARGAHANKSNAALYHRKASEYRNLASPLVLQAARVADQLQQLPHGSVTLSFGRPRGSLAYSQALYKIAGGVAVTDEEAESAVPQTLDRNVLLIACAAAGAPNDSAKAAEILGHASTITPRGAFAGAMAAVLEKVGTLFSRNQLDLPDKSAQVNARINALRIVAEEAGPAMVVKVQGR